MPPDEQDLATAGPSAAKTETWVIEPRRMGILARLRELARYSFLFGYFGRRTIERTYRRTFLGVVWIFLRPLLPIAVFTLVFPRFLGVESEGVPYFLFFLTGMIGWALFERSLMWATRSLEMNRRLLTRLYFPHLILPVAATAPAVLEFLIYIGFLTITLLYYLWKDGVLYLSLGPGIVFLVLAPALAFLLAIGIGLWTSVVGANARDVRWTLGYILAAWFFLTPVAYPSSAVPADMRWLVAVNPMAPIIGALKWGVLGTGTIDWMGLGGSAAAILLISGAGLWFFSRSESASVDKL